MRIGEQTQRLIKFSENILPNLIEKDRQQKNLRIQTKLSTIADELYFKRQNLKKSVDILKKLQPYAKYIQLTVDQNRRLDRRQPYAWYCFPKQDTETIEKVVDAFRIKDINNQHLVTVCPEPVLFSGIYNLFHKEQRSIFLALLHEAGHVEQYEAGFPWQIPMPQALKKYNKIREEIDYAALLIEIENAYNIIQATIHSSSHGLTAAELEFNSLYVNQNYICVLDSFCKKHSISELQNAIK